MRSVVVASTVAAPVVWSLLGYEFEAASMLAGLFSCFMVRVYISANTKTRQGLLVDVSITVLALLFTAGSIASQRPAPFFALLTGTGFGALGAGIIKIALRYVRKFDGLGDEPEKVSDEEGIRRAMEQLHDVPMRRSTEEREP